MSPSFWGAVWFVLFGTLAGCSATETHTEDDADVLEDTDLPEDTDASQDTDDPEDTGASGDTDPPEESLSDFELCFQEIRGDGTQLEPDYDQFNPTIGTHCSGTNHQDITGVERVVFLGDSITVGTPPTSDNEMYRNILADTLAARFGLSQAGALWKAVNLIDGTALFQEWGDFASCARWGARADDLMDDDTQVADCLPADKRNLNTLVIMTIGGNDLARLTKGFQEGKPIADLWTDTQTYMAQVRQAVAWIKEPGRFPNGVHVIYTNLYEFTDATGDTSACPAAGLAGYGDAVTDPALEEMVVWSLEQYMDIAVQTQSDMLFLLESFCGHGYRRDDASGRCYRGPDAELWFDLTCTHPNPAGHRVIADMMMDVVVE